MNLSRSWQWLPPDTASHIAQFLLDDDVVDYIGFRAVCRDWRSSTASPQGLDSCFRPRRWIMLPDGDANLHTGTQRRFLNLSTGRSLLLHLPELDSHYVISDSDGLFVLVDKVTRLVRLFNPFTRHLADLPPLPEDTGLIDDELIEFEFGIPVVMHLFTSCISSGTCPTVVFFTPEYINAYYAKPGDASWGRHEFETCHNSMLYFKGRFYIVDQENGIQNVEIKQNLFKTSSLIQLLPRHGEILCVHRYYLAEYNAEMLMIYHKRHVMTEIGSAPPSVFKVDLESNRLVPLNNVGDLSVLGSFYLVFKKKNVGDLSLFLGTSGRNLVLSSKILTSIKANSI